MDKNPLRLRPTPSSKLGVQAGLATEERPSMRARTARCVVILLAMIAAAPAVPQNAATGSQGDAEQEDDAIVVTGQRLRATQVDYRLRGTSVAYCGPRDAQQHLPSVRVICDLVEACVRRGKRAKPALTACVEEQMAHRYRP